jgi:CHASE2 domain-containing sensor protein
MMALIFAVLVIAFALAWFRRPEWARLAIGLCLVLSVGLFLWEIWSPQYGFEMPWLVG